jgi:nanoRNase/pAp phosphatase (c-di-AMP/oligoRNAs hydrolase)
MFEEKDEMDEVVATALLVGIKTDTSDLMSENVKDLDFKASQNLMSFVNRGDLQKIVNYPIPPYHFELRSQLDQEDNIRTEAGVFAGGIGYLSPTKRDALPTMAEERSRVEGIETAFVFGIVGDHIQVSVRSVGASVDVNALCQKIFGKQYAGGKMGSGAAKIPLDFLSVNQASPDEVKDKLWDAVKALVMDKIFHVMKGNE